MTRESSEQLKTMIFKDLSADKRKRVQDSQELSKSLKQSHRFALSYDRQARLDKGMEGASLLSPVGAVRDMGGQ